MRLVVNRKAQNLKTNMNCETREENTPNAAHSHFLQQCLMIVKYHPIFLAFLFTFKKQNFNAVGEYTVT